MVVIICEDYRKRLIFRVRLNDYYIVFILTDVLLILSDKNYFGYKRAKLISNQLSNQLRVFL